MMKQNCIVLIISFFFAGCASTSLTSFTDPDFQKPEYWAIIVFANSGIDLRRDQFIEEEAAAKLNSMGVYAVPFLKEFPPTKDYSDNEISKTLRKRGFQAILYFSFEEAGEVQSYVPKTSSTKGSASITGNKVNYKSKTNISGGYYVSKPTTRFTIKLIDVSTEKTAWIGSTFTGGNAYANQNTLIYSLTSKVVEDLAEKKMIKTN